MGILGSQATTQVWFAYLGSGAVRFYDFGGGRTSRYVGLEMVRQTHHFGLTL